MSSRHQHLAARDVICRDGEYVSGNVWRLSVICDVFKMPVYNLVGFVAQKNRRSREIMGQQDAIVASAHGRGLVVI